MEAEMKNKRLHIMLVIFSLVVFCTIALLFMGCYDIDKIFYGTDSEYEYEREKEAERGAVGQTTEKVTETEVKQRPNEEVATAEEESLTYETVTYTGIVNGATVILIVDFETNEVKGSISLTGDEYINANITDGKINEDTLEITTKYSGTGRLEAEGEDYPVSGTITGKINDDLSLFDGVIIPDIEDTSGTKFTATK